ncbi:MAG: hypothetical protein AAF598_07270 [Bacteroidota bacterium]
MGKAIVLLCLSLTFVSFWLVTDTQPLEKVSSTSSTFKGKILAASDADMVATAYGDGKIGKLAGIEDTISLIHIREGDTQLQSTIHASNSVMGWPAILAWNSQQKLAYVVENNAPINAEVEKVKDVYSQFPPGKKVTVIDYGNPSGPQIIQEVEVGQNLQGGDVNASKNLLVIASSVPGKEMVIATLKNGLIDQQFTFSEPDINPGRGRDGGIKALRFHPKENILAANLNNQSVAFYRVIQSDDDIQLEKIGSTLQQVCTSGSVGNWHPSGAYFLTTDVNWSGSKLGYAFNKRGSLISIAFDPSGKHRVASVLKVGLSPEGFDISPDGQYAAVVNMRRTYLPKKYWFVTKRKHPTLSLIKIDPQNGTLSSQGKPYGFEGALPEDVIFDQESNSLAVAIFHDQYADQPKNGYIEFWELKDDQLLKTNARLPVTRGVHALQLID